MKTTEEIKNKVAEKYGQRYWNDIPEIFRNGNAINEAMEEYANQFKKSNKDNYVQLVKIYCRECHIELDIDNIYGFCPNCYSATNC